MNVDILKNNPSWWWYVPFATFTTLGTFVVWIIFKRSKSVSWQNLQSKIVHRLNNLQLEGSLERRFQWLFPQQKEEVDLEIGSTVSREARRTRTIAFPAFGKKRI